MIIVTIGVGSQFAARGDIGLYKDKPDQDSDFISCENNALIWISYNNIVGVIFVEKGFLVVYY